MVHVVAYDLKSPNDTGEDYARIIEAIKSRFSWCHIEQSVWLIETPMNAGEIRDHLKQSIHDRDLLFVARLNGNWGSWNLGDERNRWLKERAF